MLNLQNAFFHFNSIRRTNHLMCAGLRSIQGLISFFHASLPNNEKLNLLKHFDLGSLGPLQISPGLQNESDYDRRPIMTHDPSSIDAESRRANERRLAAIMFSDIVGYTAMTRSNEELALELLEEHRGLLAPIFQKHRGRVVKTIGDAYLVVHQCSRCFGLRCGDSTVANP